MRSLALLRVISLLRSLVREHKRTADALEKLSYIEALRWDMELKAATRELQRRTHVKHTEFGSFDVDEADRRWRADEEAKAVGVEPKGA